MSMHQCRACVVYCMDFRLHPPLANFMKEQKLDIDGTDIIRVAGAARSLVRPKDDRDRQFLLEQLQVSYKLHQARQFYLVNHEDCGAYGPENVKDSEEELAMHSKDLRAARAVVQDHFPEVEILTYFMRLDGRAELID
ncbi:MAG: hypothetical protein JRJ12_11915 [Deltaproteobacteria bacterium]|nr:hypothetical protein [Deltaproteobacteria bacterium]MBW2071221.1 hypothetical protein [Deltaproteobacteria bacterium]